MRINDRNSFPYEEIVNLSEEEGVLRNFFSTYQMLRGMSCECLLKAILIKNGHIKIKDGKMTKKYNNHNLVVMAKNTPISFNDTETEILRLLSYWIEFARYPIPSKWSVWKDMPILSKIDNKEHKGLYWNNNFEQLFYNLLKKIEIKLNQKN